MHLKKILLPLLLLSSLHSSQALLISSFGETDFTVDSGTSTFTTINISPSNVNVSGTDFGESMAGTFNPIDITGLSEITLTGTLNGTNPNSAFTILLYNSTFDQFREYSGLLDGFGNTSSTLQLTWVSESAAFNDIAGFQFIGGGSGSPLDFTFEALSATAVPEPGSKILFMAGLGLILLWQRKVLKIGEKREKACL